MPQIFISYSRKDIDFARKLAGDLEKAGYDVWWDLTDLRGGDDWVNTIPAAISSSEYVIVVLTPDASESDWVRKEYTQALSLRKKIIPILLKPGTVPFALNTINFVNFTNGEYADRFKELLSALGFTGQPPEVTPYRKAILSLPPWFLRYGIPALIALILLLAFFLIPRPSPPLEETPTDTQTPFIASSLTATQTVTPQSPTATQTSSPTITLTHSLTPTQPTFTASATPPFRSVELCVQVEQTDVQTINVRSGPSSTLYAPLGQIDVGTCLLFSAVHVNTIDETWLLVANNQTDPEMRIFAGGWIRADLLGLEPTDSIPLPAVTLTPTPTPSETPTVTPTFTRTSTPTLTDTPTLTPSHTPTLTLTDTPTPTETETPIPTETPTP